MTGRCIAGTTPARATPLTLGLAAAPIIALATLMVLVSTAGKAIASPSATASSQQIYFWGSTSMFMSGPTLLRAPYVMHPRRIYLTNDGSAILTNLRWRHWGAQLATASGIDSVSNGIPSVATGKRIRHRAQVALSDQGTFQHRRVYRCFTMSAHLRYYWATIEQCLSRVGRFRGLRSTPSAGQGIVAWRAASEHARITTLGPERSLAIRAFNDITVSRYRNGCQYLSGSYVHRRSQVAIVEAPAPVTKCGNLGQVKATGTVRIDGKTAQLYSCGNTGADCNLVWSAHGTSIVVSWAHTKESRIIAMARGMRTVSRLRS